jgi:GNAT superfamily N-acetyltransferase
MAPEIPTRCATSADVDVLLGHVQAGFDSYLEFAPLGWQPPDAFANRERAVELLCDPATWALLALDGERPVGHISFFPGRERSGAPLWRSGTPIPGLAHLWQLFVLPAWWGRGIAPALHDAALAEMHVRGYASVRLFTPSLHARARRFYERRRWAPTGEEWSEDLGLMLIEYRRRVD